MLPTRQVKTVRAVVRPVPRMVTVLGSLLAQDQTTLSSKVPGRLKTLEVDLGSQVQTGQVLAQIEPRDYQLLVQQAEAALVQARARLGLPLEGTGNSIDAEKISSAKQARAVLEEAQANHERVLKLRAEGISSQADLDTAKSAYGVALNRYQDVLEEVRQRQAMVVQRQAELEIARQQLTDAAVRAPYEGTIQERRAHLGEYLVVGAPIVTLVRMDPLRLRMEVPERESARIRAGQTVRLKSEGGTNTYAGEVKRLSPAINEQNRMLVVEAEVRNDGSLRPGAFVRSEIVVSENVPGLTVLTNAIVIFAGLQKVLTIDQGKAVERRVTTGVRAEDWVEIVSGLREGETVVLNPGNLQSGQPVVETR